MTFTNEEIRQAEGWLAEQTFQSCRINTAMPGAHEQWRIPPEMLDEMPLLSFLIGTDVGLGGYPCFAMRLVKPGRPDLYPRQHLTPGKRLLYYFWRHHVENGPESVKKLGMASKVKKWRWVIRPGEPGYDRLDAFKIACDHRLHKSMMPTLLHQALGLPPLS